MYPLPKVTNSRKLLFISILCISIIFCVQIVKYLCKLQVCWKFHIIPTRTFIYIFLVTCVWGIPLTSVHAQKLKIEIYRLWLLHWTFPFSKAFQKIVFYFYFNSFTILQKNSGNVKFYWMTWYWSKKAANLKGLYQKGRT